MKKMPSNASVTKKMPSGASVTLGKRMFKKPTLRMYGTVGGLTTSVGNKGNSDMGSGNMQKTQA